VRFIAEHAERTDGGLRWGVEPICRVLSEHGCPIAPSTYYDARTDAGQPSRQELRDEYLREEIRRVHAENYGARKIWLQLNREAITVARSPPRARTPGMGTVSTQGHHWFELGAAAHELKAARVEVEQREQGGDDPVADGHGEYWLVITVA
jgi:hypothetical protein